MSGSVFGIAIAQHRAMLLAAGLDLAVKQGDVKINDPLILQYLEDWRESYFGVQR